MHVPASLLCVPSNFCSYLESSQVKSGFPGLAALQVFSDVFQSSYQLIDADPKRHTYLACALLMRGAAVPEDLNRNVGRLKSQLQLAHWNPDGFKTGICSKPPVGAWPARSGISLLQLPRLLPLLWSCCCC